MILSIGDHYLNWMQRQGSLRSGKISSNINLWWIKTLEIPLRDLLWSLLLVKFKSNNISHQYSRKWDENFHLLFPFNWVVFRRFIFYNFDVDTDSFSRRAIDKNVIKGLSPMVNCRVLGTSWCFWLRFATKIQINITWSAKSFSKPLPTEIQHVSFLNGVTNICIYVEKSIFINWCISFLTCNSILKIYYIIRIRN